MQRVCMAIFALLVCVTVGCVTEQNTMEEGAEQDEGQNILAARDMSWEDLNESMRRKVLFSGKLTFVFLELKGPSSESIQLHNHINDQISYVAEGEIEVQVGEDISRLGKGGFFRVPPNVPHGVRPLSPVVQMIDVFTPPREDFRKE